MEEKNFFMQLGRALLKASPYLLLAAQVIDLLNKGLDDVRARPNTIASPSFGGETSQDPLSNDIQ